MKKLARLVLSAGIILAVTQAHVLAAAPETAPAPAKTASAPAATPAPAKAEPAPDPSANHVLAEYIKAGVKVYFMGAQQGLNGWFLVKDNQVQIAYTSLDNQSILIGVLYNAQGDDVSTRQMKTLYETNNEVKTVISNINAQQPSSGADMGGMMGGMPNFSASAPQPMLAVASPGEQLMKALQDAAGVNVGASAAPKLFMVADPNCPHCQATWRALRAAVFAGKLQIRLVPIGAVDPDSERAAAQFLHTANPLDAWDKYIGGDHAQLAGTPDAASLTAIRGNYMLIDSWHIQQTPYMTYRAKDGQIKIVQGEPEQAAAIVDDIAP